MKSQIYTMEKVIRNPVTCCRGKQTCCKCLGDCALNFNLALEKESNFVVAYLLH